MLLSEVLVHRVDEGVRAGGSELFRTHAAVLDDLDESYVLARFRGSEPCCSTIELEANVAEVSCTCRDSFQVQGLCKHVWATLLTAEESGAFRNVRGIVRLAAVDHDADADDDLDLVVDEPNFAFDVADDIDDIDDAGGRAGLGVTGQEFERRALASTTDPDSSAPAGRAPALTPAPSWRELVARDESVSAPTTERGSTQKEVVFGLFLVNAGTRYHVAVRLGSRTRRGAIDWHFRPSQGARWVVADIDLLRRIDALAEEIEPNQRYLYGYGYSHYGRGWFHKWQSTWVLKEEAAVVLLPAICATGRAIWYYTPSTTYVWDGRDPFRVELIVEPDGDGYRVGATLHRDGEIIDLSAAMFVTSDGIVAVGTRLLRIADSPVAGFPHVIHRHGGVHIPRDEAHEFRASLLQLREPPAVRLPPELTPEERTIAPTSELVIETQADRRLLGRTLFRYEQQRVEASDPRPEVFDPSAIVTYRRDLETEGAALATFDAVCPRLRTGPSFDVPRGELAAVVRELNAVGWRVVADAKRIRPPGEFAIDVVSGVDWFDVHGKQRFGDQELPLPELLRALRAGENRVLLDDGSYGMVPDDWLKSRRLLLEMGDGTNHGLRFAASQAVWIDLLLDSEDVEGSVDERFERARERLHVGIPPVASRPPPGFVGELREYQREGLAWLQYLRDVGFGGCLADDMGLGKTVQTLAHVVRTRPTAEKPVLVVAPRSLIYNWEDEAKRFAPDLRVVNYSGPEREAFKDDLGRADLVLTTYGLVRRDVAFLKSVPFDTVVLDEAQAIKTSTTQTSRAVRLLKADARLALSGTPVENHLGELVNLFHFLEPGLLRNGSMIDGLKSARPDPETVDLVGRALRPLILRRTKEQVAPELPPRTEQTLHCELKGVERRLYDDLREHYRASLLSSAKSRGLNRVKIQVLEALLRLRQAACHPGLIDKDRAKQSSAKLDVLIARLEELKNEGAKALVFSQFTQFLAIVRRALDRAGLKYAYLDGRTRNRKERVEEFQNDPDCPFFLISLKAGGLGLNLTAARYVFILDPWWNPAVEAQAIDRTHRIGQESHVFAYRLIARDTVEEKIAAMQAEKKSLADAILTKDNAVLRALTMEELDVLLS